MFGIQKLNDLSYEKIIDSFCISYYDLKIGAQYLFIEKDGTFTDLGILKNYIVEKVGTWHDGWYLSYEVNFENNIKDNDLFYFEYDPPIYNIPLICKS